MALMPKQRGFGPLKRRSETALWYFWLDGERVTTPYTEAKAAEAWRRKFLAEEAQGKRNVGAENCTLADLFTLVERSYQGKASAASVRSRLKRLRDELGPVRVVDLRQAQIDGYRDDRKAKPATVNRELELLRRALNLGKRHTPPLVAHVPFIDMLKVQNVRTRRITHEQYLALIEVLRTPERYAAVIAYHTGWRLGVIRGLTWDRVDWANKVIRPPEHQSKEKRVGTAPIYGGMQDALKACIGSRYVIHRENGSPVVDIRKAWDKAVNSVGLAGFRFHDLRACAVSNLIDARLSPHDAMQIVGHKTHAMLQRYDIVSAKRLQGLGEKVEAMFSARKTLA